MRRWLAGLDWPFLLVAALSLGAAIHVILTDGWRLSLAILEEDVLLLGSILPKVGLGCLIGALVRVLVPREVIARLVGEGSGLKGLTIACLAGAIFPGGPFTIFPIAAAFLVSGADRGAAVAFVTAWLLLGVNRAVVWEMPFFGTGFVGQRMLISLPMPLLAGLLARGFDRFVVNRLKNAPPA